MKGVKQCGRGKNRELFEISVMCWEMCVEAKDCRHITYNTTELSTQWGVHNGVGLHHSSPRRTGASVQLASKGGLYITRALVGQEQSYSWPLKY